MAAGEEGRLVVLDPTEHIATMTEVGLLVVEGLVVAAVVEVHNTAVATTMAPPHMIKDRHRETWGATTVTNHLLPKTIITRIKTVTSAEEYQARTLQQILLGIMTKVTETMKVRLEVML